MRSCFFAVIRNVFSYPESIKSERIKTIAFFFETPERNSNAAEILVSVLFGLNSNNSLMILKIWDRPFLGGINNSIWSENKTRPTLSLFWSAEKAKVAAISVKISLLNS